MRKCPPERSGGGWKISTLMAMPAACGLFQKAIVQSGAGLRVTKAAKTTETARKLLAQLDIAPGDIAALQAASAETIQSAAATVVVRTGDLNASGAPAWPATTQWTARP